MAVDTHCPRCGKQGMASGDTLLCFDHGTFHEPIRGWDLVDDLPHESVRGKGATRQRKQRSVMSNLPWLPRELVEWETWRDGDPLPDWATSGDSDWNQATEKTCQDCGKVCYTTSEWGGHRSWHKRMALKQEAM